MKYSIILLFFVALACKEDKRSDLKTTEQPITVSTSDTRKTIAIEGEILHLDFNKKSNEEDYMVFFGKHSTDRFNKTNGCLELDGISDLIEIDNVPEVNSKEEITISIWYKPDSFKGVGQNAIVWKGSSSSEPPYCQYFFSATGNLYPKNPGSFKLGLSINGQFSNLITKENTWEPEKWYNLTGTYDGNKMKFYVNGALASQRNISGKLDNYDTIVLIGKTPYEEYYTSGKYDDFRVFDRALTQEEVATLYSEK